MKTFDKLLQYKTQIEREYNNLPDYEKFIKLALLLQQNEEYDCLLKLTNIVKKIAIKNKNDDMVSMANELRNGLKKFMSSVSTQIKPETETKFYKMWKVLLHNDDISSMQDVTMALCEVFHFDNEKASSIMLEAHKNGIALCKIEPYEHAEFHCEQLQSFSLISTIEPTD